MEEGSAQSWSAVPEHLQSDLSLQYVVLSQPLGSPRPLAPVRVCIRGYEAALQAEERKKVRQVYNGILQGIIRYVYSLQSTHSKTQEDVTPLT